MGETRRILDQFHRAYQGPAWHGPALLEVLKGVTWQAAGQRPIPGAHTIWELTLHITVWISVPMQRIQGAVMPTLTPAEDWPSPSYSIYTMLHGVVQHMLYHAGQIALLKRAAQ
jgi:uncharacterized damage-inducible protein DinB